MSNLRFEVFAFSSITITGSILIYQRTYIEDHQTFKSYLTNISKDGGKFKVNTKWKNIFLQKLL